MTPEQYERLKVQPEYAEANLKAVLSRVTRADEKAMESYAALALNRSIKRPFADRVKAVWKANDLLMSRVAPSTPCKKGCSHCCHIPVAVTTLEAKVIGELIGRAPKKLPYQPDDYFDNLTWGYDKPCTFLKDNACSIYESRPLACRSYTTLDIDNLMCQLRPKDEEAPNVPSVNSSKLTSVLFMAIIKETKSDEVEIGDIRDFFPKED